MQDNNNNDDLVITIVRLFLRNRRAENYSYLWRTILIFIHVNLSQYLSGRFLQKEQDFRISIELKGSTGPMLLMQGTSLQTFINICFVAQEMLFKQFIMIDTDGLWGGATTAHQELQSSEIKRGKLKSLNIGKERKEVPTLRWRVTCVISWTNTLKSITLC